MDSSNFSQVASAALARLQLPLSPLLAQHFVLSLPAFAVPAYHIESVGGPRSQRRPQNRECLNAA